MDKKPYTGSTTALSHLTLGDPEKESVKEPS